jgi:thioesterase domain-containing protein
VSPGELERYLHEQIPLTRAMAVSVVAASTDAVVMEAPLAPNINHRDTVFGGSASAVAIVAAWALVHLRLIGLGLPSRVVIQRNTMEYLRPIAGTFQARALLGDANWDTFVRMLTRKGRSRITVGAELLYEQQIAARLSADFVAFANERP